MGVLEGRDILIFGEDWGRFPSTTQHIGKVLLRTNRVMWVGSLGHRKPRFALADIRRAAEKLSRMVAGGRDRGDASDGAGTVGVAGNEGDSSRAIGVDVAEADMAGSGCADGGVAANGTGAGRVAAAGAVGSGGREGDIPGPADETSLHALLSTTGQREPILVHPVWIPWHDLAVVRRLNRHLLCKRINAALQEHGFKDVIVLSSTPLIAEVLDDLPVRSAHYLCLDDYSEFDDAFEALLPLERKLLSRVDTCFAVSDILAASRRPGTGASYAITQGVDLEHFNPMGLQPAEALGGVRSPVVGFFGLVSEWVDVELIMYAARAMPEVTFVVIGKATVDLSGFLQFPNIVYTGLVPYADLPSYASVFDVGSIPFRVNELTLACNPLKMFEYFSLGLPVVSTALPEVEKFAPDVMIARSPEEYVQQLRIALQRAGEPGYAHQMRGLARRYSWEAIADFISGKIQLAEARAVAEPQR